MVLLSALDALHVLLERTAFISATCLLTCAISVISIATGSRPLSCPVTGGLGGRARFVGCGVLGGLGGVPLLCVGVGPSNDVCAEAVLNVGPSCNSASSRNIVRPLSAFGKAWFG